MPEATEGPSSEGGRVRRDALTYREGSCRVAKSPLFLGELVTPQFPVSWVQDPLVDVGVIGTWGVPRTTG